MRSEHCQRRARSLGRCAWAELSTASFSGSASFCMAPPISHTKRARASDIFSETPGKHGETVCHTTPAQRSPYKAKGGFRCSPVSFPSARARRALAGLCAAQRNRGGEVGTPAPGWGHSAGASARITGVTIAPSSRRRAYGDRRNRKIARCSVRERGRDDKSLVDLCQ